MITQPIIYRLICASLIGAIIVILTVASHRESCAWGGREPSYLCGGKR